MNQTEIDELRRLASVGREPRHGIGCIASDCALASAARKALPALLGAAEERWKALESLGAYRDQVDRIREELGAAPDEPAIYAAKSLRRRAEKAEQERDDLRDVLLRNNFTPCDTPACNCNGWHERATGDGFYARFREIEEAIGDHNGKTLLAAVVEMVQERDSLQTEVDGTIQSRAESLAWDALGRPEGTHDTSNVQRLCEAHIALKAKLAEARAERLGYRAEYLELLRRIREGQLVTATEASMRYEGIIAASSEEPL